MPKCAGSRLDFGRLGCRVIDVDFSDGDLSSDGALMLQVDQRLRLTPLAAAKLSDPRDPGRIRHSRRTLLAQRIDGLCCGHEDLNDPGRLRELKQKTDVAVQRYHADASPFKQVATADSLLQKVERVAKRISATGH